VNRLRVASRQYDLPACESAALEAVYVFQFSVYLGCTIVAFTARSFHRLAYTSTPNFGRVWDECFQDSSHDVC
jgi:hypothetical protein